MGRKLKVYLDTSVISHLLQEDVPEKMEHTRKLWNMLQAGVYGGQSRIWKVTGPLKSGALPCYWKVRNEYEKNNFKPRFYH